jgi:hypothetical protein
MRLLNFFVQHPVLLGGREPKQPSTKGKEKNKHGEYPPYTQSTTAASLVLSVTAIPGSLHKKVAFAFVARDGRCSLELRASLFEAAEFLKKVTPDTR